MKIKCKTITQDIFYIEATKGDTVTELKQKVKMIKRFPVDVQRFVCCGKTLENDLKVADIKMDDKKFIYVLVSKKKRVSLEKSPKESQNAPKDADSMSAKKALSETSEKPETNMDQQASSQKSDSQNRTSNSSVEQNKLSVASSSASSPQPHHSEAQSSSSQALSSISSNSQTPSSTEASESSQCVPDESKINALLAMGFEKSKVSNALVESKNDQGLAIECLLHEMPSENPSKSESDDSLDSDDDSSEKTTSDGRRLLEKTLNDPPVRSMQSEIKGNPEVLDEKLAQLKTTNSETARIIEENKELLLKILKDDDDGPTKEGMNSKSGTDASSGKEEEQQQREFDEQDREVVERLKALGFSEDSVKKEYFATNKNENLTANNLLDQQSELNTGK